MRKLVNKDWVFLKYPAIKDICIETGISDDNTINFAYELLEKLEFYDSVREAYQDGYDNGWQECEEEERLKRLHGVYDDDDD